MTPDHIDVLRVTRMKGRARIIDIAAACCAEAASIGSALEALAEAEAVINQRDWWRVTNQGRATVDGHYVAERQRFSQRDLEAAYQRFCELNGPFKEAVTAWQMDPSGGINDHSDPAYDASVLERIGAVHDPVCKVVDGLADTLPRLRSYLARFAAALARVRGGEGEFLASPRVDSYHGVWFELHEDLILVAGLSRAEDANPPAGPERR